MSAVPPCLLPPPTWPRPYRFTMLQSAAARRWLKSSELSGLSRERVVSEESQHEDRVSAATSPESCPVCARWFSTNTLKDGPGAMKERFALVSWDRAVDMEEETKTGNEDWTFGSSPGNLYPPREMPTARSGAWE